MKNEKNVQKTVDRNEILKFLADELKISLIRDYCPNGLQVEGQPIISSIVSGVTASQSLIEAAIELNADTLLVHHGYFWRNENECIVGPKKKRIKLLLEHNINLLAYHLPLDCHPELGNNVQLAKILDFKPTGRFGENDIGWLGVMNDPSVKNVGQLCELIENRLRRKPLLIGSPDKNLETIGWCTGAAQDLLPDAVRNNASVFLSGEICERTVHEAREYDVPYLSCGHHATERYGITALGELLASHFGIQHQFVDIDNPV